MNIKDIKQLISDSKWASIAPEIRPSSLATPGESIKPFYLTREFTYLPDDTFELTVINFVDPYGSIPLGRMYIKGHMSWQGDHPIAPGAQKVDFIADIEYEVTPLHQSFADAMNQYTSGFDSWKQNVGQSILGKAFPPFGLQNGDIFKEYDLIYINSDMMFWGARNVDGRGFDKEENRPTNLQIPLLRK
ncbi:hypothetical protein [Dyadobacter frigoris]|uniref:APCDD1 domain-containing protein n=1 Tax=Dyadobacter frigoris TaxID=2576211 RepID=A0A4U6D9Q8_9BACT|nr:hypothetical protein [Dyadobacter frigoris]TKT93405.1 hypothetical protein FDK13_06020 [Dyadobacter frigoris]GLU54718.1 hypothetical protein Dfri01_41790 [Dyadobacter frigoris]